MGRWNIVLGSPWQDTPPSAERMFAEKRAKIDKDYLACSKNRIKVDDIVGVETNNVSR